VTTHLRPDPKLGAGGAIPLLPLYALIEKSTQNTFTNVFVTWWCSMKATVKKDRYSAYGARITPWRCSDSPHSVADTLKTQLLPRTTVALEKSLVRSVGLSLERQVSVLRTFEATKTVSRITVQSECTQSAEVRWIVDRKSFWLERQGWLCWGWSGPAIVRRGAAGYCKMFFFLFNLCVLFFQTLLRC